MQRGAGMLRSREEGRIEEDFNMMPKKEARLGKGKHTNVKPGILASIWNMKGIDLKIIKRKLSWAIT